MMFGDRRFSGAGHGVSGFVGCKARLLRNFWQARSFRGDLPYSTCHKIPENIVSALSKASLH
jgi:hypothetical protein